MKKIAIFLAIGACSCRQPSEIIFSAKVNDVTTHYRNDTVRYIYQRRDPSAEFHISLENPGDKSFSVGIKHYGRTALSDSCSFWVYYNHGYDSIELFSASCKNCADRITVNPNDSVPIILHTEFLDFVKVIGSYSSPKEVDDKIDEIVKGWSVIKYLDHNGKQIFSIPRESVTPLHKAYRVYLYYSSSEELKCSVVCVGFVSRVSAGPEVSRQLGAALGSFAVYILISLQWMVTA